MVWNFNWASQLQKKEIVEELLTFYRAPHLSLPIALPPFSDTYVKKYWLQSENVF